MGFVLDFTDDNDQSLEDAAKGREKAPGWYHVRIEDVFDDEKTAGVTVIKFEILDGPIAGVLFERLRSPDLSDDAEKAKTAASRLKSWAKRLGLVGDGVYGTQAEIDFINAIGWEGFLKLKAGDPMKGEDGKVIAGAFYQPKADYVGVYPLDYPPNKFPKDFDAQKKVWGHLLTGKDDPTVADVAGRTGGKAAAPKAAAGGAAANGGGRRKVTAADL